MRNTLYKIYGYIHNINERVKSNKSKGLKLNIHKGNKAK